MLKFSVTKYKDQLLLNGMSSKDVATAAGLQEVTISRAIKGKSNLKPKTIATLAKVLKCTPADLLEEVDE